MHCHCHCHCCLTCGAAVFKNLITKPQQLGEPGSRVNGKQCPAWKADSVSSTMQTCAQQAIQCAAASRELVARCSCLGPCLLLSSGKFHSNNCNIAVGWRAIQFKECPIASLGDSLSLHIQHSQSLRHSSRFHVINTRSNKHIQGRLSTSMCAFEVYFFV